MKRILIITDNHIVAYRFEKEILSTVFNNVKFKFYCSPSSNLEAFEILKHKIKKIDLNMQDDIDFILKEFDMVISLHCSQIFPKQLIDSIKCINVHPGYNPVNRGIYPQVFAILNDTIIGATIHEIDHLIDHGAIIDRATVKKYDYDTSGSLYGRILDKEIDLLKRNINSIIDQTYSAIRPDEKGKLHTKKDFRRLKKLNLDEKLTMKEALTKLRALTHNNYNNAFYISSDTGEKVYVKLDITTYSK